MRKGFTLVELSIVLVIIGLLIGGILVGQVLIESAKMKKLYNDIVSMEVVAQQFYQKYKQLPGDSNRFPNPGNNNGSINQSEYRDALFHLASAGMLPEKYKNISTAQTGYVYDEPHDPKRNMIPTDYDGVGINYGLTEWTGLAHSNCTSGSDQKRGNYLRVSKVDLVDTDSRSLTSHYIADDFISRNDYLALDKKYDDGNGRNGKLWAYGGGGEYATNYACTRGYNNCVSGSSQWVETGFDNIAYNNYDGNVPTCGIIYWYDYK